MLELSEHNLSTQPPSEDLKVGFAGCKRFVFYDVL